MTATISIKEDKGDIKINLRINNNFGEKSQTRETIIKEYTIGRKEETICKHILMLLKVAKNSYEYPSRYLT